MRLRLLAVLGAAVLVVGAGVAARPAIVAALAPTTGASSPVAVTDPVSAAAPVSPATPVSAPPSVPASAPTAYPACRGTTDLRTTDAERSVPFTVCGVELISKDHRVTAAYQPKLVTVPVRAYSAPTVKMQPAAGTALVSLFAAARRAGYTLVVRSSWRSYATQDKWYATMSHARTAPPGASEHQSGLAVDLGAIERGRLVHGTTLGTSRSGTWILRNAAAYGFILRYPTNESKITGIDYEPWHFRYVGVTVAKGVEATKTKTLEQYLGVG